MVWLGSKLIHQPCPVVLCGPNLCSNPFPSKFGWFCIPPSLPISCSSIHISKKYFCPGGMALSEWRHSVRAVRDTPEADYSAPGVITMYHIAFRSLVAVSLFLLALSVPYFKWTHWHCGKLGPYITIGSLGMHLHQDYNAMGNIANISPCVSCTCMQNAILFLLIIHIIPSRQIYVAIDNPSLIPSVSCFTISSYLSNYVCAVNGASHSENLQSNGCQWLSHLYKFQDWN